MRVSRKPIAIFGAGGFGMEVATIVAHLNSLDPQWDLIGFFDDAEPEGKLVDGYPVLGGMEALNRWPRELFLVLALGIPRTKRSVHLRISNPSIRYPVLIHPSVIIGNPETVSIGEGSIICAGTIITTQVHLGRHVILNLACTVGHQSRIGDYSSFMPTCNVSGEVGIGEATFWGTGSKIINRKRVGNDVTVGAGAVVIEDLPDGVTAVGVPARVVKEGS